MYTCRREGLPGSINFLGSIAQLQFGMGFFVSRQHRVQLLDRHIAIHRILSCPQI
jgi:hypothetical protein